MSDSWIAPSVMFIEMATDSFEVASRKMLEEQRKQIDAFGALRANKLGADFTEDFKVGYDLGLQTARVLLRMSTVLNQNGIDPSKIL